jgi:hypothetical protein
VATVPQAVANDFVFDEGVVQRGDVRALDGGSQRTHRAAA